MTSNNGKPDFFEYYINQIFKSRHRRISKNKKSNKYYREKNYITYEYIYTFQFAVAAIVMLILCFDKEDVLSSNAANYFMLFVLYELIFVIVFPLRYFLIKFEEVDIGKE